MAALPVVVVGAGPVGLTAALLLARRGLDVVVLERHPAPYALPRAVHLDDEALRVLQAAGVADEFARSSRPMAGLRLLDRGHRVLAEFGRDATGGRHGWPQGSLFHQPDLEAVLERAVRRTPGVTVRRGAEVTGLTQDGEVVTLDVRDRGTGAGGRVTAAAVVGCDGANSTVRRLIGGSMRPLGPADRWLVLDARSAEPLPMWPGVHQVCDRSRPATFLHVTRDRYRWEFRLAPGESAAELAAAGPLAALVAPFRADDLEIVRAAEYTFRAEVCDRWRTGRVLLAGDAAHLTPPFIGQGLALGLRDVHQLAWKLADVLTGVVTGAAAEELLDTHQAERAPHARALIRVALLVGRLMTGGGSAAAAARRGVLALVPRLPALAALAGETRTPPLRRGPLVRRRGRAGRRVAGSLVPQPVVLLGGRRCRLDDVLGPDWAELSAVRPGVVAVRPDDGPVVEVGDVDGVLTEWLRRAGTAAVIVRPDRIVQSAGQAPARTTVSPRGSIRRPPRPGT